MARSFILSFSRPSRKSSQDFQQTNSYQASESLWSNPGGKAEAVLGPFEPNTEKRKKLSRKDRKLQKHPSSVSITVSDRGSSRQDELNAGPITNQPETHHFQGPSPVLRPQSMNEDVADWDNKTDVSGLQAHRSQSSSTLRSYYDPAKSPLYISQQTSASSARDMALRKGQPQIMCPKRHDISSGTTVVSGMDDEYDLKRDSMGKRLHMDLSTLFPKPSVSNHMLLSPNNVVRSPSVLSVASSNQQSSQSRPKWFSWERKKSKESISSEFVGQTLASVDESIHLSAMRMTKNAKRASQTWFEGLEDEENASIDMSQHHVSSHRSEKHYRSSLKVGRDPYSSDQSHKWGQSHQSPKPYLDSAFARRDRSHSRRSRTSSNGSQKSVRWEKDDRKQVLKDNLQNHSFLILTSSDDEIDESSLNGARYRRHRIRASIEKLDNGDVIVCSAERVKQIKPRPVVNIPHRKTPKFQDPEVIPPVPLIPLVRPEPSPRVSSMKWREETTAISPSIELMVSPAHSRQSSGASHSASQVSSSCPLEKTTVRGSKMMAVTEDEEKLLEGMRRKRASLLRKNHISSNKGSLISSQSEATSLPRPKTAGEALLPRSSYFESNKQLSPQANGQVRFLAASPYAASADDLSREESFSSSDTQSSSVGSSSLDVKRPSKMLPPSLDFSPPNILPSISPSHTSPLTPPPDQEGCLDIYGAGVASPHSPSASCPNKGKHDRKKTLSSGIVVLDGAEQHAQALDEENEIAGWAMDRW